MFGAVTPAKMGIELTSCEAKPRKIGSMV